MQMKSLPFPFQAVHSAAARAAGQIPPHRPPGRQENDDF